MTYELLSALALFAFVSSITPGPNNIMLMASGVNFGFLRTLPHMLGVGIGFVVMILGVGLGLANAFETWPIAQTVLKIFCVCYLLWLAWRIATQPTGSQSKQSSGKPFNFLQAALFQWVNPKAWAMAVTATTLYAPTQDLSGIAWVGLVFGMINLPSVAVWTLMGQTLSESLQNPHHLMWFNRLMAGSLVVSLYPLLQL